MSHAPADLTALAFDEMVREGFHPDFDSSVFAELETVQSLQTIPVDADVEDLRSFLWSSIDNQSSRDLDQIEFCETTSAGIRLLVGIADVSSNVPIDSAIDRHAAGEATSVYALVRTFPMLPEKLSAGLTSLNEGEDRLAVVIEMLVAPDGVVLSHRAFRALVRNRAQLAYETVGPWLEGKSEPPPKVASSVELQVQLRLQDSTSRALRRRRQQMGALRFDRIETIPVTSNSHVEGIKARQDNRANELIEDFMVEANISMAQMLKEAGHPSLQRVVKVPERWKRIVDLAAQRGGDLPATPDSRALQEFLDQQRNTDPSHYPDLSLAVLKLMGPGEYVVSMVGEKGDGHFGLAAHDYAHSTAPNRRFADLVTQRLLLATLNDLPSPYTNDALVAIARNCTLREDAARKVERTMIKRIAALALSSRIGEKFAAVVTGVTPKGVFVRIVEPPAEGILIQGEKGVDVGDKFTVTLVHTDVARGYLDFSR